MSFDIEQAKKLDKQRDNKKEVLLKLLAAREELKSTGPEDFKLLQLINRAIETAETRYNAVVNEIANYWNPED